MAHETSAVGYVLGVFLLICMALALCALLVDLGLGVVGIDLLGNDQLSCTEIKQRDGPYARCYGAE